MNPCRTIDTRRNDSPEISELFRDYHEGIRIASGQSFKQAERRHLVALKRQIDFLKDQIISNKRIHRS
jgi:hypothetical protein